MTQTLPHLMCWFKRYCREKRSHLFFAFGPNLMLLLLGRAIAGITSANISVATAYIIDISSEQKRTQRFGLFNAIFGIGFMIGPVLGGVLGEYWVRLPFIAAALLSAFNVLLAFFIQGLLASTAILATLIGPLAFSSIYFVKSEQFRCR